MKKIKKKKSGCVDLKPSCTGGRSDMRATTQPTHRLASLEDTVAQVEGAGGVEVGVEGEVKESLRRERIKTKIQEQAVLIYFGN